MTLDTNKAMLRAIFEAVNNNDFDVLENHPGFWETRLVVPPMHALFHDWQTTHMQQIAEDGKIFSYAVTAMTHVGQFAGVAPANTRIALMGLFLDQVADGAVVEHNGATAWPDVLRQLGHPAFRYWPVLALRPLAQAAAPAPGSSGSANKAVVARLLSALSRGDEPGPARHAGIGPLREEFAAIRAAFPDLRYELVMQAAEGDLVSTRATLRGTHQGELWGFAPTGRAIAWDLFSLAAVTDGAVADQIHLLDWTAALMQLGLFPG